MKFVVDTNCLLRILPQKSKYRCIWNAFLCGEFELCYTTEILHEYEEILSLSVSFFLKRNAQKANGNMPVIAQITIIKFYNELL
jgi:predicted nucleic acid-binding protein